MWAIDQQFNFKNIRRLIYVLTSSIALTVLCVMCFSAGYFRGSSLELCLLLLGVWSVNTLAIYFFLSGKTAHYDDPSLTIALMFWAGLCAVVASYYVESFRVGVLATFYWAMLTGAFRKQPGWVALAAVMTIIGYACVIVLVMLHYPMTFILSVELLEWLLYSVVAVALTFAIGHITSMQKALAERHTELNLAKEKIQILVIRDELTGFYNRRHIMQLLGEQQALTNSDGEYSFVLCYMDLDHFKKVNDRFGHMAGDIVLKVFSQTVTNMIRAIDAAGRLGGEEFVVIFAKTDEKSAAVVGERIRAAIESTVFSDVDAWLKVTVSMGITGYRKGESLEETLVRADALLYRAKSQGRNRIVTGKEQALEPFDKA